MKRPMGRDGCKRYMLSNRLLVSCSIRSMSSIATKRFSRLIVRKRIEYLC